jgi:hypothetical protein
VGEGALPKGGSDNVSSPSGEVGRGVLEVGRGAAGPFVRFSSLAYGLRAAFCILDTYRRKYQDVCVEDIINRWAPPSDNDTRKYVETVCRLTGFGGKERLEESQLPALVHAMAFVECGALISKETILKGFRLFKEIQNSKLKNQKL